MEDGLLFVHIVGAAMWLGGGIYALYAYSRIGGSAGEAAGTSLNALAARNGWYFGIATLLVLASGIGMVIVNDEFGWTDAFVLVGIGGIVVEGAWQGLMAGKAEKRMLEAFEGSGEDPAAALRRARQLSYGDLVVLLVVVYAMIAKWGVG